MSDSDCLVCGDTCELDDGCEWPDDKTICWGCLYKQHTDMLELLKRLKKAWRPKSEIAIEIRNMISKVEGKTLNDPDE